jgi:L-ascorbate metabolism protein UlaG (beta-lactamase superfamily)
MKFRWIGGPTFELEVAGFHLLTDPMFGEGPEAFVMHGHPSTGAEVASIARLAPLPAVNVNRLDAVVVSHLHSDHFDAVAAQHLPRGSRVVAPLHQAQDVLKRGFREAEGLTWWQTLDLERGDDRLSITAVPAQHSHDEVINAELGLGNGYLFEYLSGETPVRVYWTGDTVWFDEMREIQERAGEIDLLVPHLGAVGIDGPYGMMTLDSLEAVRVIELFQPRWVIPIHHHTFSHYVEPVSVLEERLAGTPYAERLKVLKEGESFSIVR